MFKGYVKWNGMWVKVYEMHGWYDVVCWVLAFGLTGTIGFCIFSQVTR